MYVCLKEVKEVSIYVTGFLVRGCCGTENGSSGESAQICEDLLGLTKWANCIRFSNSSELEVTVGSRYGQGKCRVFVPYSVFPYVCTSLTEKYVLLWQF